MWLFASACLCVYVCFRSVCQSVSITVCLSVCLFKSVYLIVYLSRTCLGRLYHVFHLPPQTFELVMPLFRSIISLPRLHPLTPTQGWNYTLSLSISSSSPYTVHLCHPPFIITLSYFILLPALQSIIFTCPFCSPPPLPPSPSPRHC